MSRKIINYTAGICKRSESDDVLFIVSVDSFTFYNVVNKLGETFIAAVINKLDK